MDLIEALHHAARQYCNDRVTFWRDQYSQLDIAARATKTIEAFARENTLAAIRSEVERFLPRDFASLDEARSILTLAAQTARNLFTEYTDPTAIATDLDERQQFSAFVRTVDNARLSQQRPLPFRRVLGNSEHKAMHAALVQKWGQWYGGYCNRSHLDSEVVTLHVAVMEFSDSYSRLRDALVEHGVGRLFELREYGEGLEIPVESASFEYNGAEGFWTSDDLAWLVYASHESSITFGGQWLVERVREILPEFNRYIYKGWDLAAYA